MDCRTVQGYLLGAVDEPAGAAMVAARQNDGSFGGQTWVVGTQPGQWRPTPPTFAADGAWVAHVKPFLIPGVSPFLEKATWSFWRPVTAVQLADTDGNPATAGDPAWMPLLITPPFPDYTSGHTCASGASMSMFRTFFHHDDIAFSAFSEASGTTRHFTSISQALTEVINARVWGGIHFRSADIDGARIGAQVAGFVARHAFRPMQR
jgi:hypothetical protein